MPDLIQAVSPSFSVNSVVPSLLAQDIERESKALFYRPSSVAAKDSITAQLFDACMSGDAQFVRDLLNQGARVDSQDESGRTALHHATQHSQVAVVRELIRRGAQVSIQDENGWTALHYAALNGNKEIANLLLESGANEGVKDKDGWTYRELLEMLAC